MGLESIVVKMRTYGGTQFDMLQVSEETGVLASIQATSGSTMTEYTWNNTQTFTGLSPLTFTCSNATNNKGIGFSSVVINATGAGVAYERYITSCQSESEVELVPTDNVVARKILVGGQIYIMLGEQLFNLQGQRVK